MSPVPPLLLLTVLVGMAREQQAAGFFPSFIFMSSPSVSSFVLGNTTAISLHLVIGQDVVTPAVSNCGGPNSTCIWYLTLDASQSFSKVTLHLNRTLLPCSSNETECCSNSLHTVETLQVVACQNSSVFDVLRIQAEIFANSTFRGNVSENVTVIPNQVYQPLGPCPCDLTTGACDIRCCCDQECTPEERQLFSTLCYTGVFGGNVMPPFDQLCTVQAMNNAPDWFPFLCVQSPLDNTPFLGLFYQGATVSGSQEFSFKVPLQHDLQPSTDHYKQGDPIVFTDHNDYSQYVTIPQSMNGQCIRNSPVAFLQNFDTVCTYTLANCSETSHPTDSMCANVTLEANYTFIWEGNLIKSVNVSAISGNVFFSPNGILMQRFRAEFVNVNSSGPSSALSGNPGYQIGRPVIVGNESTSVIVGSQLNLWKPAADGLCTSATRTPVLFGEDATSGCFVRIRFNENCTQIRKTVSEILRSLVPATHVAKRGNSNASDLSEWAEIIYREPNNTTSDCAYGVLQDIPANLNIQIITTVFGAVEGILQQEILAVTISYSTAVWQFQCNSACENYSQSFPISASVQFIKIPAQPPPPVTSFQMNYREYDCNRNEVCWPHLAYPMTQCYTGETYSQSIAKGLVLVAFFLLAALLGSPWNLVRKAWNTTTF
ncbi:tectonic-2 isoform X2 [Microcaecilia unicolor]|uniref:Tectonic-2 isoform X2 n=1 Tax=Microcaecilia unicolor TaxID=1415580 RepID=A0A6P7Z2G4_9AMPH|nr:tectonic-2 isoform X2 [Microcaecilia unicolor]